MSLNVQWTGIEKVRANLISLAEKYPKEVGAVLREEGVAIIEEATRICPYDQENEHTDGTPHLNETGQVAGPYFEDGIASVVLSFGEGIDSIYPIVQHEVQEFHHDFPEQWKFLEHPLNERGKYLATNLIKGVDMERMLVGYAAPRMTQIKSDESARKLENAKTKAMNKAGNMMGRYR